MKSTDEDNFWLISMGMPKRDDRPPKGMIDPKRDDQPRKGWLTPKGMTVDTVFCYPGFGARAQKIWKYYFLFVEPWEHPEWRGATRLDIGAPKVPFLAKMTKMPLVNPRFDWRSNEVKTLTKQHFSQCYIKPELLRDFWQLWLEVDFRWSQKP